MALPHRHDHANPDAKHRSSLTMPDGHTHTAVNMLVLSGLGVAAMSLGQSVESATPFAVGFLIGTLLITPDLDFGGRVRVQARKNWGILGGIWYPLGLFVKHRGITHTYLRGSTLLLGYAGIMLSLLGIIAFILLQAGQIKVAHLPFSFHPAENKTVLFMGWGGYFLAYGIHLWMDGIHPWRIKNW